MALDAETGVKHPTMSPKSNIRSFKHSLMCEMRYNLPSRGWNPQYHSAATYKSTFHFVRETKLQAFQFHIFHRVLPWNKYLKQIRVWEQDTCVFCGECDTIKHIIVQRFNKFWPGFVPGCIMRQIQTGILPWSNTLLGSHIYSHRKEW